MIPQEYIDLASKAFNQAADDLIEEGVHEDTVNLVVNVGLHYLNNIEKLEQVTVTEAIQKSYDGEDPETVLSWSL